MIWIVKEKGGYMGVTEVGEGSGDEGSGSEESGRGGSGARGGEGSGGRRGRVWALDSAERH